MSSESKPPLPEPDSPTLAHTDFASDFAGVGLSSPVQASEINLQIRGQMFPYPEKTFRTAPSPAGCCSSLFGSAALAGCVCEHWLKMK